MTRRFTVAIACEEAPTRRFCRCLMVFLCVVATAGAAAPPATNAADGRERDLGLGLAYHRVHQLPADLPPPEGPRAPACVVDLRYVRSDGAGAKAFETWLASRATRRAPVFVLANGETASGVVAAFRQREPAAGVMVIGIPDGEFLPDVAVVGTAEAERRAYDAFENGATIASLLTDNPGKLRYDETSLARDRRTELRGRGAGEGSAKEGPPPPPVDAALQRAVHLHRALVALGKI